MGCSLISFIERYHQHFLYTASPFCFIRFFHSCTIMLFSVFFVGLSRPPISLTLVIDVFIQASSTKLCSGHWPASVIVFFTILFVWTWYFSFGLVRFFVDNTTRIPRVSIFVWNFVVYYINLSEKYGLTQGGGYINNCTVNKLCGNYGLDNVLITFDDDHCYVYKLVLVPIRWSNMYTLIQVLVHV